MFSYDSLFKNPKNSPVCLVAEIGINHDGDESLAYKMIEAAASSGADAVKFQIYHIDGFYHQASSQSAYSLFEKLSLSLESFYSLRDFAHKKDLLCFAAPFSRDVLDDFIEKKIFPIKIASGDALTEPWINLLIKKDIPFIVSCGALNEAENKALVKKIQGAQAALLYCVSQYPAPPESFDLLYLDQLQALLPNQAVGFSDHSQGIALSLAAAARGAKIIERHFTLSPERTDYDHPLSLSPQQFSALAEGLRAVEKALGKGQRTLSVEETKVRPLAGRSVYLTKALQEGESIEEDSLAFLRPGNGVSSAFYQKILGSKAPRNMAKGENLSTLWDL